MFVPDIQLTVKRRVGIDQPVYRFKLKVVELFFCLL
jgi:hypothetical protein